MKYAVEQHYFKSGRVDVFVTEVGDNFQEVFGQYCLGESLYDDPYHLYIDTFKKKIDAVIFLETCFNFD